MAHFGIDLGTSNTLVAKLNAAKEPVIVYTDEGKMLPSAIYIGPSGDQIIGQRALNSWADPSCDPARSFLSWKPAVGEDKVLARLPCGQDLVEITPEYLTTLLMEHIIGQLTAGDLGSESIESVLITIPHGWRRRNPKKCDAIRRAVERAISPRNITLQPHVVSEPIAAAAYWIWEARKKGLESKLQGNTVLVCDVGGGTFDLSLVQVGNEHRSLDVVDATNNDIAGDYVDALLLAHVCQKFNEQHHTNYPTTAESVLQALPDSPLLRQWYITVRDLKRELSDNIRRYSSPLPSQRAFIGDTVNSKMIIKLESEDFISCLQPFYAASRKLIQEFLKRNQNRLPAAVLLAGGGSRVAGLREHVLIPALKGFYPDEATVLSVIDRIPVNQIRTDEVIALGAALIANGVISVQERLLNDIGLILTIEDHGLASKLGLSKEQATQVLITPILRKGAPLPAVFKGADLGVTLLITQGESLELELVVDEFTSHPWIQRHEIRHPGSEQRTMQVDWEISADVDGRLKLRLKPEKGKPVEIEGRWERGDTGRLVIAGGPSLPRITPEQLRQAAWQQAA